MVSNVFVATWVYISVVLLEPFPKSNGTLVRNVYQILETTYPYFISKIICKR